MQNIVTILPMHFGTESTHYNKLYSIIAYLGAVLARSYKSTSVLNRAKSVLRILILSN